MLIVPDDVRRFESLVSDIGAQHLSHELALVALQAFFAENPHLLMLDQFDEHEQRPLGERERWAAFMLTPGPGVEFEQFELLPQLKYRTPSGRWATLVQVPALDGAIAGFDRLLFSFRLRQVLIDFERFEASHSGEDLEALINYNDKLEKFQAEILGDSIAVSFDDFITKLRGSITAPRVAPTTIWSPRMWTPNEQARQRRLVDDILRPHLNRWAVKGLCLEDLNPSEFEDLVAELLFKAGLKVYKVRESPQGGRDLIARGSLIPDEEPVEMAVEVKHRKVVDRPEVQLALYQNRAYPALVFVTSGRFTAGVFKEKLLPDNCHRLLLKDGIAVGDMVRDHFGIRSRESSS